MYGSNDYGSGYYGQGPTVGSTFTLHSVSATVVALASISAKLLINHAVSATVTATATISRLFMRTLSDSVTTAASLTSQIILGLNIRKASTKFLNMFRGTRPVAGFSNTTKHLNLTNTTKRITES